MYHVFGPQKWWPGDTPLEVNVGAILTQNTAWTNVEKAVGNLKRAGLLPSLRAAKSGEAIPLKGDRVVRRRRTRDDRRFLLKLYRLSERRLARLVRPSGYFNIKAKRLKHFIHWVVDRYGSLERMYQTPTDKLRQELLQVNGLGPETVDSILLYGGNKLSFVVDAYTKRILGRHHLAKEKDTYHEIQKKFVDSLPPDVPLYNEYHALFVKVGKDLCRKKKPLCGQCPLNGFNW